MKKSNVLAKIASLALVFCMVLSIASCGLFGGSLKLDSFAVDRSTVKTSYYVGEDIADGFKNIKAYVTYSDEELNAELTYSSLRFTYPDNDTVGQKQVTVSYNDPNLNETITTTVDIVITEDPNKVVHASYRVDASAVDTTYYLGETVDLTGLKLFDVMSNKTEVEITDLTGLTFSDYSELTATAGTKEITATYNGESAGTITVRVIDPDEEKNHVVSVEISASCKTTYEAGESLDLTGLTVKVTYEEGEPQYVTTGFTAASVDMSTVGTKTVKVTFLDPINGEEEYVNLTVNVVKRERVIQFAHDIDTIASFNNDNGEATQNPEASGFSGHFSLGGKTYVIGDDNEFKMVPTMKVSVDGVPTSRTSYYMDVTIEVEVEGSYVTLTRTAVSETKSTYSLDGKTLATVDTYNGLYKFEEPIAKVRITVLPSATHYTGDTAKVPVTLEATVIDAYNVHNAKQLSVIENNPYRTDWNALKTEWGVAGIDPAGIVLHSDIKVTYKDVPASFFYDAEHAVQYYNTATGEVRNYSEIAGMKYLKDRTYVYQRTGNKDFVIEGNFFTVNTADFPLIASPSIFENKDKTYGSDYSNSALFCFETYDEDVYGDWANGMEPAEADVPDVTFNNVEFVGNAGRDCWVIQSVDGTNIGADNELVTAGGLILVKSARYTHTTFNNVNSQCFFINYFAEYHGDLDLNDVKCYDAYQSAIFVWGDSILNVHNTFMNGAGGPVIMPQSINVDGTYYNPVVTVTGVGNIETHLGGQEAWFKSVDPTGTVVSNITALGGGLSQFLTAVKGVSCNFVDGDGMMNMKVLLMPGGSNAADALADVMAQGTVKIGDDSGIERWREGDTFWADIYAFMGYNPTAAGAPFLTVKGADGTDYTMCYAGDLGFIDLQGNAVSPATHAELLDAFATADEIILSQGGMSMLFELYH